MGIVAQVFRTAVLGLDSNHSEKLPEPDFSLQSPIGSVIDWFIGLDYPMYNSDQWLSDTDKTNPDAAPILKLASAIIQQGIHDGATRIELWTELPQLEYHTCETPGQHDEAVKDKDQNRESAHFARIMAVAGISGRIGAKPELQHEEFLNVLHIYNHLPFQAMTVPTNLIDPLVRLYPFHFNYHRSTTLARPENLLYVETKTRAAYASIDHYDRSADYKVGITLDYE